MIFSAIKQKIDQRFQVWLRRRIPPTRQVTLDQRRVFIFPSMVGLFFGCTMLATFVGGINYANSLILALTFYLSSVFVVSILHTFRNLSGLTISAATVESCFAGDSAVFKVDLSRQGTRTYEGIRLFWDGGASGNADLVDLKSTTVSLFLPTESRGLYRPGRLKVETHFPVGLLRAWTWVDLDVHCYVYPKPLEADQVPLGAMNVDEGPVTIPHGSDDFDGHQRYQPGDSLNHVDWKTLARGQTLYTKTFVSHADDETWLDWETYGGSDLETRLSYLCYWVLRFSEKNRVFGLRLPGSEISPDCGIEHKKRCLMALATFDQPDLESVEAPQDGALGVTPS